MQQKGYFAQQKYVLIVMLGDDNENVKNVGMVKMVKRWKQVVEESANNDDCPYVQRSNLIH